MQLNLRAVTLVLGVNRAELVALAFLPVALARFVPRTVGPHHTTNKPPRIAKAAREKGFAFARGAASALREESEEIGVLTGSQGVERGRDDFGTVHGGGTGVVEYQCLSYS